MADRLHTETGTIQHDNVRKPVQEGLQYKDDTKRDDRLGATYGQNSITSDERKAHQDALAKSTGRTRDNSFEEKLPTDPIDPALHRE